MEIAQIQERIEQGQRVEDYETVRVRKDSVRIKVSLIMCPIRNATGEIPGVAAIGRESTELKQAEKSTAGSEIRPSRYPAA